MVNMSCDDVILELGQPSLSDAARAHLATCAECQLAAGAVAAATLPPLSRAEELQVASLAEDTWSRYHPLPAPPSRWRTVASLALAASVGALIASAGFLLARPAPARVTPVVLEVPALPEELLDTNLPDEQVFFEVAWPSIPDEPAPANDAVEGEL